MHECTTTTTTTTTTILWLSGLCPRQPEWAGTIHLSWSSIIPYLLSPSFTIHGILPIQFTCLTVIFNNLSPSFLWSASWPDTSTSYSLHFFIQTLSSRRSICPYHCNLFCCSTKITSSNPSLSTLYLELYLVALCHTVHECRDIKFGMQFDHGMSQPTDPWKGCDHITWSI